ncbi:hypothetical protein DVH24_002186 [Malus domestica]|uniref:Uncharacterized protein n=1 Tax=Malus domestica TaxID=3750 RepID=A0A498I4J6_MALDO|nr:hypothetical protein DVH24_002186 [Malus domestica]
MGGMPSLRLPDCTRNQKLLKVFSSPRRRRGRNRKRLFQKRARPTSSSGGRQGKMLETIDLTSSAEEGFQQPSIIGGGEGGDSILERVRSPVRGSPEKTFSAVVQK